MSKRACAARFVRTITLGVLLCLIVMPTDARGGVCDATSFNCQQGPCLITGAWDIGTNCTLDFGSLAVEVRGTLKAETTGGSFTIRAGQLTLQGGKLKTLGDTSTPGGNISLDVTGLFAMSGSGPRVDTSGIGGGGSIAITAEQVNLSTGLITADGGVGDTCGDAGRISLEVAGDVQIDTTIRSSTAGGDCYGGSIAISGAAVNVSGDVDARGGASAADDAIVLRATAGDLIVTTASSLRADGTGQPDGSGADGGNISLNADVGNISLAATAVSLTGQAPDGFGGTLTLHGASAIELLSHITAQGGLYGSGGVVSIDAAHGLAIAGDLTATGGASFPDGEGGVVELSAGSDLLVTSTIDVSGPSGGSLRVSRASPLSLLGTILARGATGPGGEIDIQGCVAIVQGRIDTGSNNGGTAGSIVLKSNSLSVGASARLEATPCTNGSCVVLATPPGALIIAPGSFILPAPVLGTESADLSCP